MTLSFKNPDKNIIRHIIYIGFGSFICAYAIFILYWISHKPYAGFYTFPGNDGLLRIIAVDPGSMAEKMGLQSGDQILKVNGEDYLNPVKWLKTFKTLVDRHARQITYRRGPSVNTVRLTFTPPAFPYLTLLGVLLCFLTIILCFLVYRKRPYDPYVRIFYLAGCSCGLSSVVIYNFSVFLINPHGAISCIALFCLPLFLHFSMIFPEKKEIVRQYPIILYLIYIPVLVWIFFAGFLSFRGVIQLYVHNQTGPVPNMLNTIILMAKLLMMLIQFYLTASLGCVAHTFFTAENQERKKQIMWLFWGGLISLSLGYIGAIRFFLDDQFIQLYLAGGGSFPVIWIAAHILFFFSTALSILKYKLMDIDIIIHRSLTYILVSGVSLLLYFLIFGVLSRFFEIVSGKSSFSVYAISALIVAFIFRPLLTQIERRMDKLFFHDKYELHSAVETLIHALTAVRDTKVIFEKVFHTVEQTLHVRSGGLWLLYESEKKLEKTYDMPHDLNAKNSQPRHAMTTDHPLIIHLKTFKKGLTHYQVREDKMPDEERENFTQLFNETRMEIFLPLIFEDSLLGIIGFGEKHSGDLYSSYDMGMLNILAHQAAIAMENARAYHQIKLLNSEMAEKVRHIEQQHNEILVLQKQMLNENIYLREELRQQCNFEEIIGSSTQMKQVLAMVEKVAPTSSTVLIRGESGTGKELIARAIHFNSPRQERPFIKVNCAAIPANLLESELFGHEKGAFTGAVNQKQGKFEMASGGTIFLDEIGDLEPDLQVKLLRVLQEKEFERVGGTKTIITDVRILSATNRNIESAISQKKFREDLFYRLNVITIALPPLRNRNGDIRELTIHFIKKFSRQFNKSIRNIDPDAMKILKSYSWPGNVRELANIIERAMVLGEGETLSAQDLPQNLAPVIPEVQPTEGGDACLPRQIKQLEHQQILQALEQANGNKSEAARILGMKRTTLSSKLKRYKP